MMVNINIRFCNTSIVDDNISEFDMPASYRKVSANQLKRNHLRAQDHKAQSMPINNKPISPPKTRSKTSKDKKRKIDSPPEYNRELSADQSNIGLNIDTPVSTYFIRLTTTVIRKYTSIKSRYQRSSLLS